MVPHSPQRRMMKTITLHMKKITPTMRINLSYVGTNPSAAANDSQCMTVFLSSVLCASATLNGDTFL